MRLAEPVPLPWLTIETIKSVVCEHFGTPAIEMVSARRNPEVSHPRQMAMYLATQITPHSLPLIGKHFGGKDHTTVIHAKRAVQKRVETRQEERSDLEKLMLDLFAEHLSVHGNTKFAAEALGKDEQWGNQQFALLCAELGEPVE